MPKMKTVRGAAKRFKASKNRLKRGSAFRSHILTKKSTKRMRGLKESHSVDSRDLSRVKLMLGKA
jgi:large subunit ribosomal protein L35